MKSGTNLVFLGPPGAGKGTQAQRLCGKLGFAHISTGDLLRAARASGSPLGEKAKSYMDRGELVPDGVICDVVAERLKAADCQKGWVLDGFPRTRPQAEALDKTLGVSGQELSACVYFHIDHAVLLERLTGRLTCRGCGRMYHVKFTPPAKAGVCDACGSELYQRADDTEDTVKNRLDVYQRSTSELIDYYRLKGLLKQIPADGAVDQVTALLEAAISGM